MGVWGDDSNGGEVVVVVVVVLVVVNILCVLGSSDALFATGSHSHYVCVLRLCLPQCAVCSRCLPVATRCGTGSVSRRKQLASCGSDL
jgi:hypothetical protein